MSEFVALTKVWENPELLGRNRSLLGSYVDYTPDIDAISVDIGFQRTYQINRKDVGWRVWCCKRGRKINVYTIPEKPIPGVTFARTRDGWQGIPELCKNITKAASCTRLKGHGGLLTFKVHDSMPRQLQELVEESCWIFKKPQIVIKSNYDLPCFRNGQRESVGKYCSNATVWIASKDFFPVVQLPENILVKIGSRARNGKTPQSSLRLMLP